MVCACIANFIIGIFTVIVAIYFYIRFHAFTYWERRKVLFKEPTLPMGNLSSGKVPPAIGMQLLYDQFKGQDAIAGIYIFTTPAVLVLDPELVKNILIRDFNYFHDRGVYYNERDDPLSAHLFALEGHKWKTLRAKLTPTFTSGKMKMMFETVLKIANEMQSHLEETSKMEDVVDIKDVVARYTTDVIGSCAFGIDCNSIQNPEAEFRIKGSKMFAPNRVQIFKIFFATTFRNLARKLRIKIMNKEVAEFFIGAVDETVKYRKENNIVKNDFMHLLIELYDKGEGEGLASINEVAGQANLFFLAGFETSSTTIAFCLHKLGEHQEIQDRVRKEINEILTKHGGEVTYESLSEMTYLDQVISETLRMYPSVPNLIRKADRDYKIDNTNHIIEKGTLLFIPVYGMQRDPKIFPDPNKFDPERFNEENKNNFHPFAYLPFGEGPRNCIGMRFGKMQTQLGLIKFLQKYKVSHCAKTAKSDDFEIDSMIPVLKGGFWLKIEKL